MARSFNKVVLVGNIATDTSDVRSTVSGKKILRARIAVDDSLKESKKSYFFTVVFWDKLAEIIQKYTQKGTRILVEGRLVERIWQTTLTDGTLQNRSVVEIVAENVLLLDSRTREPYQANQDVASGNTTQKFQSEDIKPTVSYSDILEKAEYKPDISEGDIVEGDYFEDEISEDLHADYSSIDEEKIEDMDTKRDFDL